MYIYLTISFNNKALALEIQRLSIKIYVNEDDKIIFSILIYIFIITHMTDDYQSNRKFFNENK